MAEIAGKPNILVAIDEHPAPVWQAFAADAEITYVRDGLNAYRLLSEDHFDLTLIDLYLTGMDSLELLRRIRAERLCPMVVLTSEVPSFSYAQQGILYGVTAYLLRPLQEAELREIFDRLRSERYPEQALIEPAARRIVEQLRSPHIADVLEQEGRKLNPPEDDLIQQSLRWKALYEELIHQTFQQYPWLKLYHHPKEFDEPDLIWDQDRHIVRTFCNRKLSTLNQIMLEFLPAEADRRTVEMLTYLLQTIDQNWKQVEVAKRFYITNSTMSTRFQRQLGISYREYITRLKIRRAQYLLHYTDVRAKEIAAHLGYKDRSYFAKLFQQRTGTTLQECERQSEVGYYCI